MVKWFGERGDAPVYENSEQIRTVPVGATCLHCPDPIAKGDSGFVLPYPSPDRPDRVAVYHRDCFRQHVLGGLPELGGTKTL